MDKKLVNSLVEHLVNSDIQLTAYRNHLALEQGGVIQICPKSGLPCNSSCVFFNLYKAKDLVRVILSCQSTNQRFVIEK